MAWLGQGGDSRTSLSLAPGFIETCYFLDQQRIWIVLFVWTRSLQDLEMPKTSTLWHTEITEKYLRLECLEKSVDSCLGGKIRKGVIRVTLEKNIRTENRHLEVL